jgi:hypothetical protein
MIPRCGQYAGLSNYDSGNEGTASRNFTVGSGGATLKASSPSETATS